jgi:hypothetical protein
LAIKDVEITYGHIRGESLATAGQGKKAAKEKNSGLFH